MSFAPLKTIEDLAITETPRPDVSSFTAFTEEKINNFITAVINTTMFLPHYFSVKHLLKTLFLPWKNLTEKKKMSGEGLDALFNRLSFNIISRLVGSTVRIMTLITYLFVQIAFVLFLPIAFTIFLLILPLQYLAQLGHTAKKQDEEEKKVKMSFISSHMLDPKNQKVVEEWYLNIVEPALQKKSWYDREKLFSIPPIARDWTAGYTPTMDQFCQLEMPTSYDVHIIGRQDELSQMEHTLLKTNNANLLLVGLEGTGRETLIQFFSQKIYYGQTHSLLAYKRVLTIDIQKILSVSTDQTVRLTTLGDIFAEAHEAGNVILVIHDLDQYVSSIEGHIDCSDILAKYATSNQVTIIATSTPESYQKYIYPNKKVYEIFTKINIEPVSVDQAISILLDLSLRLEKKYQLTIPYETIVETVFKAQQFVGALPLPESAVNLLDEAASTLSIDKQSNILTPEHIDTYLEQKLHVPTRVTNQLKQKLLTLEKSLSQHIIDQPVAIKSLSSALKNAFVSGGRLNKSLATFLFLGPTGVGKTETAKAVSKIFFGTDRSLIRLDMPNFQTSQDIVRLLGNATDPGILTEQILETPYGVLLLDEIEKANHDLLNIFLSVIDEGYFTNGRGDRVDCKNLIIIATSNAGADFIFQRLGSNQSITTDELLNELIQKNIYSPEFLNRFDGVIMFQPLSPITIATIAKKLIANLDEEVFAAHQVHIAVQEQILSDLITKNYNPQFGARGLKRIIDFEIKEKISSKLLSDEAPKGSVINI